MRGKFVLSYLDYFVYLLTCFAALFVIAYFNMNEESKKGNVIEKAEYIIEANWKDCSDNDVDLWVAGPDNTIVYFAHADGQIITLDRDDQGVNNRVNGVVNCIRREVVTIRANVPGDYTVNVMMYKNRDGGPEQTKVIVRKLNPYVEIIDKTVDLEVDGEEKTILNFTLDGDGKVIAQDEEQSSLFTRVK